MNFDRWMKEKNQKYKSTDDSVMTRALREAFAAGSKSTFKQVRDGIANAVEDWPDKDYYPPTIAEMIREIGPTPTTPNADSPTSVR